MLPEFLKFFSLLSMFAAQFAYIINHVLCRVSNYLQTCKGCGLFVCQCENEKNNV